MNISTYAKEVRNAEFMENQWTQQKEKRQASFTLFPLKILLQDMKMKVKQQ